MFGWAAGFGRAVTRHRMLRVNLGCRARARSVAVAHARIARGAPNPTDHDDCCSQTACQQGRRVPRSFDPIVPAPPPKLQTYRTPWVPPRRQTLPVTLNLMTLLMNLHYGILIQWSDRRSVELVSPMDTQIRFMTCHSKAKPRQNMIRHTPAHLRPSAFVCGRFPLK